MAAATLGELLVRLARTGALDPVFLGTAALTGLAVAVLVGLVCGGGAARRARAWRPSGD
ncbi:MAG TPA: hypothetical protein VGD72_01500 [Mycobacteriales bacterium]